MNELNPAPPNQDQREAIYFWLRELEAAQFQYTFLNAPVFTWWIHVTDLFNGLHETHVDIDYLCAEMILTPMPVLYQPQGDWRDRFAPSAYALTTKGRAILENPRGWIFRGEAQLSPNGGKETKD